VSLKVFRKTKARNNNCYFILKYLSTETIELTKPERNDVLHEMKTLVDG